MADYRTFYKTQREKGKTDAQAKAAWTKAKGKAKEAAQTERDVVTLASLDIYALADRILGQSDFLHEAGMMSTDSDRKTIAVELSRSRDTKTKKGWSTWGVDDPAFVEGLRGIQKKYKPHGLKMTVAVRNPSAAYSTAVALPGLTARAGDKFYYPTRRPELGAPGVVAEQQLPAGMEIVPRMHSGKNGKRLMVFCLFLDGSDTGRYATSPERAAELATRLKVEDGKVARDYSGGAKRLTARFNPETKAVRLLGHWRLHHDNGDGGGMYTNINKEYVELWLTPSGVELVNFTPKDYDFKGGQHPVLATVSSLAEAHALLQTHPSIGSLQYQAAKKNPFWVSPEGKTGYLSEESHAAYKQKHPTRGLVPSFMERQVRIEAPRSELPAGWEIRTVTVPGLGGKPQEQYHLFFRGKSVNKYALDWNKAVDIAKRTDPKTGKRIYGSRD